MKKYIDLFRRNYSEDPSQYRAFLFLSACIFIFTLVLNIVDPAPYQRFIGNIHPILAIIIAFIAGQFSLAWLSIKTTLKFWQQKSMKDYLVIAGLAVLFGLEIIIADIWVLIIPPTSTFIMWYGTLSGGRYAWI